MSELEKMLKDIVYGGVGAVASMVETGSGLAKTFVEKGQKIVQQAKPAAEDWNRKIKGVCDEAVKSTGVDISKLTREQREQLAALMTKLNRVEDAAARAMKEFVAGMKEDPAEEKETVEDAGPADAGSDEEFDDEDETPDVVVEMPDTPADEEEEDDDGIPDDEESNG